MWQPLLEPGRLAVVQAPQGLLRGYLQELTHHAVHAGPGAVLWCDGAHSFDPAEFAELNLVRGRAADDGALRVLVKRCMTPFQWDSTLHAHLDEKLATCETRLVVVNPFDTLWSHEEIADWEQEDYTRFSLKHLREAARRFRVPILLGCDLERWSRTHPVLAQATAQAVDERWWVTAPDRRWRAVRHDGLVLDPDLRRQVTLLDFLPEERGVVPVPRRRGKPEPAARPFRTRIVHAH